MVCKLKIIKLNNLKSKLDLLVMYLFYSGKIFKFYTSTFLNKITLNMKLFTYVSLKMPHLIICTGYVLFRNHINSSSGGDSITGYIHNTEFSQVFLIPNQALIYRFMGPVQSKVWAPNRSDPKIYF